MSDKLRMSGLISGIDTESIISALVSTKRIRVNETKGEQTKLSWKQEIWKDLNKDLKSLQSLAGNLRFSSAFAKKTTAVSDSSKASVITSDKAVNSVQSLEIRSLAKTAYLTGGTVGDGKANATALTKLGDLGFSGSGSIKVAGTDTEFTVDSSTTISDVLSKLQKAGLNATFDANNQRLFISAKNSGDASDFSLTATNSDGADALAKLGLQTADYYSSASTYTSEQIDSTVQSRLDSYLKSYGDMKTKETDLQSGIDELMAKYGLSDDTDIDALVSETQSSLEAIKTQIEELDKDAADYDDTKKLLEEQVKSLQDEIKDLGKYKSSTEELSKLQSNISSVEANFDNLVSNEDGTFSATASDTLKSTVEADYVARAKEATDKLADSKSQYASKIDGSDAEIYLNGAKFTSSSNTFNINGLTITAMATTKQGEAVTLTTDQDTSGIYDMVKDFFKKYNEIANKLDKLYSAESAKGYKPLTDEEKEALSESEAEKYEQKIKDSLLRRDSTVDTIKNAMYDIMSSGFKVGDKTMRLSDFGISTLDYFTAADNEKHSFHIDGDADDENVSGNENKLKAMIASDPDSLVSFFTQLSQSLYSKMSELSSSVTGYRSFGTFYNDKQMSTDYTDFTSKITSLEDKVSAYEDKLYKQYGAMEKMLAKMQSNSNAIAGMVGMRN